MVHKLNLPSQVTVYPSGYHEKEAVGFWLPHKGIHKIAVPQIRQTYVKTESSDPTLTAAHEIGHDIWEQLTPEEKDEFIFALESWQKRELPQLLGKRSRTLQFPSEQAREKKVKEDYEYYAMPTEAFARMTAYATNNFKLPKRESEEAFNVWKKIMRKRDGNFLKRIKSAGGKVESFIVKHGGLKSEKLREGTVSLKGI